MGDKNLVGRDSHNDNHVQSVTRVGPVPQMQDNEEVRLTGSMGSQMDSNV